MSLGFIIKAMVNTLQTRVLCDLLCEGGKNDVLRRFSMQQGQLEGLVGFSSGVCTELL